MAAGPLIRIVRILLLLLAIPAFGGSSVAAPCFDLNQPNVTLLQPPPTTFPEIGKESESFGKNEKTGFDWAIASGRVNKPLSLILEKLLKHGSRNTILDPNLKTNSWVGKGHPLELNPEFNSLPLEGRAI